MMEAVLETLLRTLGEDLTDGVFCAVEAGAIDFAATQCGTRDIAADRSTSAGPSRSR